MSKRVFSGLAGIVRGCLRKAVVPALQENGHAVRFHDLYAEQFDPILPYREIPWDAALPPVIERHCAEIAVVEEIVFIHPNWWGQPPAILKGWVDRVLRPGVAYRFAESDSGEGIPLGLLRAKAALVFNTTNTPSRREQEVFGDPLDALWKTCICSFCGIAVCHRRMFGVIVTSTDEQRKAWIAGARELTRRTFPKNYG